ncbi:MAG TPA: YceI family protein [Acidimicrobiia bacterium]|jgi:polyisoprenoid-binding protein YceI|nr:YceI family protein [Acidimicrobiia bacterium]
MAETTTVDATRVVENRTVPTTGRWSVDNHHSTVEFVARHLMVTKVRGRFLDYDAAIDIAERPEDSRVDVTIQAGSISTGDEGRDGHVVGADFLDVEQYPTLTFHSTAIRPTGASTWRVDGDLTIHGVTRPTVLDVEFGGVASDPWGNTKAFFSASTEIDREDFGLTWNQPLAGGGVLIGKKVRIELEVQATPAAAA